MEFNRSTRLSIISCLLALTWLVTGLTVSAQKELDQKQGSELVQVETKYVCMINNQRFDKEQIPVEVSGKTYYGCCEMCKTTLKNKPASRMAIDPVSGKRVDKARAVIGAASDGKVFYFENQENLKRFKPAGGASTSKHPHK
jgi:YHS domain-containing protein